MLLPKCFLSIYVTLTPYLFISLLLFLYFSTQFLSLFLTLKIISSPLFKCLSLSHPSHFISLSPPLLLFIYLSFWFVCFFSLLLSVSEKKSFSPQIQKVNQHKFQTMINLFIYDWLKIFLIFMKDCFWGEIFFLKFFIILSYWKLFYWILHFEGKSLGGSLWLNASIYQFNKRKDLSLNRLCFCCYRIA